MLLKSSLLSFNFQAQAITTAGLEEAVISEEEEEDSLTVDGTVLAVTVGEVEEAVLLVVQVSFLLLFEGLKHYNID